MHKSVKIVLLILAIASLWVILASIDAGLVGLGVVLSVLALLDIVTGEFSNNNKMVWLMIILAALIVAVIGIGIDFKGPTASPKDNPAYALSTVISLILPVAYFVIGRRQKITKGKKPKDCM